MKRCCVLGLALAVLSLRAAAQDHTVFMDVAAENLFRYSRVLTFRSVPKSVEMVDPRVSARTAVIVENSNAEPFVTLVTGDRFTARLVVDGATRPDADRIHGAGPESRRGDLQRSRQVAGLLMPFRIVTTSNGRLLDELVLDEILVNPELSKSDFKR